MIFIASCPIFNLNHQNAVLTGYCGDTLLSYLDYQSDDKRPPLRGRDRLGSDPHWVPDFLSCCSWTFTEQVRTCGFRRNLSSLDKAPRIRDSVRLKFFESFLLTLPSISSETWEMYSWANSGSSVFCDWLSLAFSGVSLETAANFLLFLKMPWYWGKKSVSGEDWIEVLF